MDAPLNKAEAKDERATPAFDTALALRRMASIVVTLGVIAGVTYFVPSFERVRPWVRGEGMPVVRLFVGSHERSSELPDFQGTEAAVSNSPTAEPPPIPAALEQELKHIEHEEEGPLEPPKPAVQGEAALTIGPEEYDGMVVPIENPEALNTFYAALRRSALGNPEAITRVSHYGDSSVAADEITYTARRKLQLRFGDSGHGFMLTAKGNMFYGHRDVLHRESDGWDLTNIVRRQLKVGYYGYGGVVSTGKNGDYTTFGTSSGRAPVGHAVSRFEVFYQRYANGGELGLALDNGKERGLATRATEPEDAWELIKVPDGEHALTVHSRGEIKVYGVSQERDTPGVVYDALGLVGARAERLLGADPQHMAAQIAHRNPDMLVLGFGGNEAGNNALDLKRYGHSLEEVIKLMRSGKPEMSCLLFGPLDQGERNVRGDVVTLHSLPGIVDVQRQVASEQGCAFFDAYKGMGGNGAVGRWYRARPRLFSPDFRHATPAGYALIGEMYYRALLKGFADYLSKHH